MQLCVCLCVCSTCWQKCQGRVSCYSQPLWGQRFVADVTESKMSPMTRPLFSRRHTWLKRNPYCEQDSIKILSALRWALEIQSGICIRCLSVYWHIDRADEGRSLISSSSDSPPSWALLVIVVSHIPEHLAPICQTVAPVHRWSHYAGTLSAEWLRRSLQWPVPCVVARPPWRPWDKACRLWGPTKVTWFPSWVKIQGSSDLLFVPLPRSLQIPV